MLIDKSLNKTGLLTKHTVKDETLITETFQDVEPNFEVVKAMRNDDSYTSGGIKSSFAHALHIPEVVQVELLNSGVNVLTAPVKDIVSGLRRIGKYDLCAVTKKKLWRG